MPRIQFPPGFEFGVATSAFQIEGAWDADGKGPSIWDTFGHTPGRVVDDIPGDVAVDHYHRFRDDIALLAELGVDAYRFSLSWSRIIPDGVGRVNQAGVDFYRRLIDGLLDVGIAPNVTLYHWDLPQALEDRGGWPHRDAPRWFAEYAEVAFREFGDVVPRWSTVNEPIALWVGYGMGAFAPGRADEREGRQAMHHALVAHGHAAEAFRARAAPGSEIGIVIDVWQRHPATDAPADRELARRDEDDSFRFFLEPLLTGSYPAGLRERLERRGVMPEVRASDMDLIQQPLDYLGLNVYSRVVVSAAHHNPQWWTPGDGHPGGNFLDNGMEFYPRAVYDAVMMVRDDYGYRGPVIITENGMADGPDLADPLRDAERIRYVAGFLSWISRAIEDGADIRGYFLWSFLDNYEWAAGFSQRFGIYRVEPTTLRRVPKDSAAWYRRVIAERGFEIEGLAVE